MASHELQFTVSTNGVEDPNASYDSPGLGAGPMDNGAGGTTRGGNWGHLSASSHPIVCIFHMLFKGLALFLYIFGGWFAKDSASGKSSGANFIIVTVFCILMLAADFWVVKNITGRLLVGLRWWNKVEGDTTRWIFESSKNKQTNRFDSSIFWTVLYVTPFIWSGLLVIGILKFNLGWLIIVVMALGLSGANVYGYYKCSSDQKAQFEQMVQSGAQAGVSSLLTSSNVGTVFSMLAGTSTNQQPQQQQTSQQYV